MPEIETLTEGLSIKDVDEDSYNDTEIQYCTVCGRGNITSEIPLYCSCKNNVLVPKEISDIICMYIGLAKAGNLKKYYLTTMKLQSLLSMNNKRMIHQLLIHHNHYDIKKETVDKIYNANIN